MGFFDYIKDIFCVNVDDQVEDFWYDLCRKHQSDVGITTNSTQTNNIVSDSLNNGDKDLIYTISKADESTCKIFDIKVTEFSQDDASNEEFILKKENGKKCKQIIIKAEKNNNSTNDSVENINNTNQSNDQLNEEVNSEESLYCPRYLVSEETGQFIHNWGPISTYAIVYNKIILINSVKNLLKGKETDNLLMPSKLKGLEYNTGIDFDEEGEMLEPHLKFMEIKFKLEKFKVYPDCEETDYYDETNE
ncbi:hypothetical protein H312_00576 [Anncaliia algerae PRA339]|uniref:Uncharacterized protein n=1 Tax=Anncaliia algerae PRA339 TaxID=1288291 RepID=A0A059F3S2_9MICR|nr:hypothetical protein H312_00576 [Anncaliia algerae PRA339]